MGPDGLITLGRVGTTIEDRLILGDVSVLEDMYSRSGALLYAIAGVLDPDNKDRITAAVFSDAWGNRRDFDPSRGSVQAWLVRQARLSYPMGPESDRRVDELVVAATVADMDDVQRQILIEGSAASGRTEDLAEHLDLPVGTVESHLRRGIRSLQSELTDSRLDEDDSRLAGIVGSGRLESDLVDPPSDVWNQIVEATGTDETIPMQTSSLDHDALDEDDSEAPAMGLVDEFSATEFPGRTPLQPDLSTTEDDLEEDIVTFDSDGLLAVDNDALDSESDDDDDVPSWGELDADEQPLEHSDEAARVEAVDTDTGSDADTEVDIDGDTDATADDDVPYILSGHYRPGLDDDPYAAGSAGNQLEGSDVDHDVNEGRAALSSLGGLNSGSGLAGEEQAAAERLAAAEATYFDDSQNGAASTFDLGRRPWVRIAIVAVAVLILLGVVLSLG